MTSEPENGGGSTRTTGRNPVDRRILEDIQSKRPGTRAVRVQRPRFEGFARTDGGRLEASLESEKPTGPFGALRRLLIGTPIHSELESHERLTKKKALAVFSSDALSSVAYAPQETLIVLLAAGVGAPSGCGIARPETKGAPPGRAKANRQR